MLVQYKVNEVLLREGETEKLSCATFVRKAFVSSDPNPSPAEMQAQEVNCDDLLYCSKPFKHTGKVSIGQYHELATFQGNQRAAAPCLHFRQTAT